MERTEKLLIALIVVLLMDWLAALYCRVKSHIEEQKARIAVLKEENQRVRDEIEAIEGEEYQPALVFDMNEPVAYWDSNEQCIKYYEVKAIHPISTHP